MYVRTLVSFLVEAYDSLQLRGLLLYLLLLQLLLLLLLLLLLMMILIIILTSIHIIIVLFPDIFFLTPKLLEPVL